MTPSPLRRLGNVIGHLAASASRSSPHNNPIYPSISNQNNNLPTSIRRLNQSSTMATDTEPIYFWREYEPTYGFLSQWYECPFEVDGVKYWHTEQWMMMEKARLFKDEEAAEKMRKTKVPKEHQALGRKVKNYDGKVWDQHKSKIVEEGNYHKFTKTPAGDKLREKLLETGDRELVEASPYDRIWGVGFWADEASASRLAWGENLLGKAITNVRERIKKEQ
ncbi:hypothetical protein B9Z65_4867 [Elsinoe australis]|uniref:NADAR domain-containing protein n=1 Tax=Elsinoe australis TaxID=40998 RepID=A0A2P8A6A4_9PEZI|nr:hypothetical protein B9Z65_4867 [Elsinoe australis]